MKPPVPPPDFDLLLAQHGNPDSLRHILTASIRPTVNGRYRSWDTLRQLDPPVPLTARQWWLGIKLARMSTSRPIPLRDLSGRPFTYTLPDAALEMLMRIDQQGAGGGTLPEQVATPQAQRRYLVSSLIEEAITSSQLEGASTTRKVAKEMIRSGRAPRTRSERMIVNNYAAMNLVRDWALQEITPSRVLELHRVVTDGTLDDEASAGRLQRTEDERVVVADRSDGRILHVPPPAEQLPDRLRLMCLWANGDTDDEFVHPVIRAILLHFWLAFDHPFEDGNGRTARSLFYWAMLRERYWIAEFLSISRILLGAPAKYGRSFLHSEIDGNDTTYFIMHQLGVICRAIDELQVYLKRKMQEIGQTRSLLQRSDLNNRQVALLGHALRHPGFEYTYNSHATSHRVAHETARQDLLSLETRGYLRRRLEGKRLMFQPVVDLADRIAGAN